MQLTCPDCDSVLEIAQPKTARIECPICEAVLAIESGDRSDRSDRSNSGEQWGCEVCGTANDAWRDRCEFCEAAKGLSGPIFDDHGAGVADGEPASPRRLSRAELRSLAPHLRMPSQIRLGEILSTSARIFSANAPLLIAITLLEFALFIAFSMPVLFGLIWISFWANNGNPGRAFVAMAAFVLTFALIWTIYHGQRAGHHIFMLKLVRGQRVSPADLFGHARFSLKLVGLSFVWAAFFLIGAAALIVPAVVVWLLLWPYERVVVDRNPPGLRALTLAGELVRKNFSNVTATYLVLIVLIGIVLSTFPLAFLVTTPFASVGLTVTYLRLLGEPTVVEINQARRRLRIEADSGVAT